MLLPWHHVLGVANIWPSPMCPAELSQQPLKCHKTTSPWKQPSVFNGYCGWPGMLPWQRQRVALGVVCCVCLQAELKEISHSAHIEIVWSCKVWSYVLCGLFYGGCFVGAVLWDFYVDCFVGTVLWGLFCGGCFVGTVLWGLFCGGCFVGTVLWGLFCGDCFVGTVLWGLFCWGCFVGAVLWGLLRWWQKVFLRRRHFSEERSHITIIQTLLA